MAFESSFSSRRRVSTRDKEKSTEREEHIEDEDSEKSKKKYESRNQILENKMRE
jgi:hypothetical protein